MPTSIPFSAAILPIKLVQSELFEGERENSKLTFGQTVFTQEHERRDMMSGLLSFQPHLSAQAGFWLDGVDKIEHGRFIYTTPKNRAFSFPVLGESPPSWFAVTRAQENKLTNDYLILHIPWTECEWQSSPQIMASSQAQANIKNFEGKLDNRIPIHFSLFEYHVMFLNIAPQAKEVSHVLDTQEQQKHIMRILNP